jgi:polyadenylate-binding protein
VFLKNLPDNFTKDQLDRLCTKFGEITSSMVASKEDGKGRGFGFVNFKNANEAQLAVEKLNGLALGDGSEEKKEIFAGRAQKKEEREKELRDRFEQQKRQRQLQYAGVNLYVKNLSDEIDDDRLKNEFSKFGQITCARVMTDNQQPAKTRGFGFVCFSSPEEATKAVTEMNGHMLDGKPLYVALAQRKEVRRAQLEAQHAARHSVKMGLAGPQMYPGPGGAPIFYQPLGGMGRQPNYVYPNVGHQMVPRQPFPQVQNQMMVRGQPTGGYSLMPVPGGAVRGGRQGGGRGAGGAAAGAARGGARQGAGPNKMQGGRGGAAPRAQGGYAGGQRLDQRPGQDHADPNEPVALTIQALAAAPEEQKKQMIGERLFPLVQQVQPSLAGKITGMLLEMDNGELIHLLESGDALKEKISEALAVLEEHASGS